MIFVHLVKPYPFCFGQISHISALFRTIFSLYHTMNIPKFASIILLALFALTMSKDATKEARVDIFDDCPGSVDGFILVDSDLDRDLGPLPNILDWVT